MAQGPGSESLQAAHESMHSLLHFHLCLSAVAGSALAVAVLRQARQPGPARPENLWPWLVGLKALHLGCCVVSFFQVMSLMTPTAKSYTSYTAPCPVSFCISPSAG